MSGGFEQHVNHAQHYQQQPHHPHGLAYAQQLPYTNSNMHQQHHYDSFAHQHQQSPSRGSQGPVSGSPAKQPSYQYGSQSQAGSSVYHNVSSQQHQMSSQQYSQTTAGTSQDQNSMGAPAPPGGSQGTGAVAGDSQPQPIVYLATYSNVPVYELICKGVAVMRRRADGFLNATQILKVAGIEKAKRTKILEKEILVGEHEKVQGGYGKYQGTWIPLKRAQELAATYNVAHLLRALLEFDPRTADSIPLAGPKKRANPNAPANSAYFKTGPGAVANNAANKAASSSTPPAAKRRASPVKGPSQQPRFLQLRAPASDDGASTGSFLQPGSAQLIGALSQNEGIPPGSTPSMKKALSNYSQYGYTPQGVPLPMSGQKRSAFEGDDSIEEQQGPTKRARASDITMSSDISPPRASSSSLAIGPSPVKDLSALAGPDSHLRGASHPRLHRVPLGPPDELVRRAAGNARFADRPQPLKPQDEGEKRVRERLVGLFMAEDQEAVKTTATSDEAPPAVRLDALLGELRAAVSLGGVAPNFSEASANGASTGPAACVDTVIDDHGHSALHWASALSRISLVRTLVARSPEEGGSNVHAGNYAGETALHRSVLVTNAYDSSLFPDLLRLLGPSLHTRDFKSRTVLHHIALVAALKGRATPARYYLASVLEHVAKHEGGRFAALVDAQDDDGETALGIAARQGNNSMVKMLLEVGARKDLVNCFGLKASDWGIDGDADGRASSSPQVSSSLSSQTKQGLKETRSDVVASLMRPPQAPLQKSEDVLVQMRSILDELSTTFNKELTEKQEALTTAQSHLQSATRELTKRRKMIGNAQGQVAELEEGKIRIRNLKRKIAALQQGAPLGQSTSKSVEPEATLLEGQIQSLCASGELEMAETSSIEDVVSSLLPSSASPVDRLVALRFLQHFYTTALSTLSTSLEALHGASRTEEGQCRKVVAMYSRIPADNVEGILEELVQAVETYSEVDLPRVAGFLAKAAAAAAGSTGVVNGTTTSDGMDISPKK